MATQDDWIRINFRLPKEVYTRVKASAEEHGSSLNAEVIRRIEHSYDAETWLLEFRDSVLKNQERERKQIAETRKELRALARSITPTPKP